MYDALLPLGTETPEAEEPHRRLLTLYLSLISKVRYMQTPALPLPRNRIDPMLANLTQERQPL